MSEALILSGLRVLVAEDQYLQALDCCQFLEARGAEVVGPCATCEEAIQLANARRPTHAVVDIALRDRQDFELAATLQNLGVKTVLLTGYDRASIPAPFKALAYLTKPLREEELIDALTH